MHKTNPRRHSPQQNKKPMLTTAAYFKVSTPIEIVKNRNSKKRYFRAKTEKEHHH